VTQRSDHLRMYTYRATTSLPTAHRERAVSALRADLLRQVVADDAFEVPDWTTLSGCGPDEMFDERGNLVFGYRATVECRSVRERLLARA